MLRNHSQWELFDAILISRKAYWTLSSGHLLPSFSSVAKVIITDKFEHAVKSTTNQYNDWPEFLFFIKLISSLTTKRII